jgi:hypothetical protein
MRRLFFLLVFLLTACGEKVDTSIVFPATPSQLEAITVRLEQGFEIREVHYSEAGLSEQTILMGGYLIGGKLYGSGIDGTTVMFWTDSLPGDEVAYMQKVQSSPFIKGPDPVDLRHVVLYTDFANGRNLERFLSQ